MPRSLLLTWTEMSVRRDAGRGYEKRRNGWSHVPPHAWRMRVQGAGCRVQGAGCRVQGAGCRVQGAGYRVQDLELRV